MLVRLAFAIATAVEPEILLVDEVLCVGDMSFQEKARRRMREMISRAQLIVVVSHDLESLAKLCDRGVWLDHGQVRQVGPIGEAIAAYKVSIQGGSPFPQPAEEREELKEPETAGSKWRKWRRSNKGAPSPLRSR
jgi:ABC-type polysaccharide/polyol phosphate transport system ATPase subunit